MLIINKIWTRPDKMAVEHDKMSGQKTQKSLLAAPKTHFFGQKWDSETTDAMGLRTSTLCNTLYTTVFAQAPHVKKLLTLRAKGSHPKIFFYFFHNYPQNFFLFFATHYKPCNGWRKIKKNSMGSCGKIKKKF